MTARRLRILLISANRERVPYPVLPIGLAYIAASLDQARHTVRVEDLCFSGRPAAAVRRAIEAFDPDLIGIGLRNMDNCDYRATKNFVPAAAKLVRMCRAYSRAPIVLGGSAVSVMPDAITEALKPDFSVIGDGEVAMLELAEAIAAGGDPTAIPGVCTPERDAVRMRPPAPVPLLDRSPLPRIYKWVGVKRFLRYEGVYPLQSKRGCALECVYCTYINIEGKKYRFRSGESVAAEIEDVWRRTGVLDFEFVDSTFNAPPHHAIEICRAVAARRLPVRFIGGGMNPVATTPELLHEMKAAGFRALVSTAESASDRVLRSLGKGFNRAHLDRVAGAIRESGLPTLWIFLIGGPGETRETVQETLDFIHDSTGPGDVSFVTSGVRIYPNTPLEKIALDQGVIRERGELIAPRFYFSPALDPLWLRGFLHGRARRDPRIITSEMSQGRMVPVCLRILAALGVRKPYWRFAPMLNRTMRWVG